MGLERVRKDGQSQNGLLENQVRKREEWAAEYIEVEFGRART